MQCKFKRICSLIEIDKLLKIKEEIIEGFIKNIEDDISIITILGTSKSGTNELFKDILEYYSKKENDEFYLENTENLYDNESIQIYTHTFNRYSKMPKSKIIFFLVNCIDKKIFTSRLYALLHTMSSIIVYNTTNLNLSEIEYLSELKKCFSNFGTFDEFIKSLSPKFIFVYHQLEKDGKIDKDKVKYTIEKEDIVCNSFVKYYLDRYFFTYTSLDEILIENLDEIIFKSHSPKNFRGKRIEGLTLKHLIIELVNCINQNISFNISKIWDNLIQKEIKFYQEKTLTYLKQATENFELKSKDKIISYEEILEKIYKIEIEGMRIHSLSYELNADSFTNTEYMNWFNYSKSKVASSINKSFSELKESMKNNSEHLINEFLNSNFDIVDQTSKKDLKEFLNEYKTFCLKYINFGNNYSDSLTLLIDFMEIKRPDLYKTCFNTLLEKKKLDEKNKDSMIDKLKASLSREKEKNEKLDLDLKSKEDNLNDLESEINKQKRLIKELNEKIAELDQSYKNMN